MLSGSYVDPSRARITVGALAQEWLAGAVHLRPTTRVRYAGIIRRHIQPRWGSVRLSDVSHGAVQAWVSTLGVTLEPATERKVHRVLSLILALAVKDSRVALNPLRAPL